MATISETTDTALLELLRKRGALTVTELSKEMAVTGNAVRQRLTRLIGQDLVQRGVERGSGIVSARGRPSHIYSLTEKARREAGNNFADLAVVLWREIRAVKDPAVRRGLLQRVADALAEHYAGDVRGGTLDQRMQSLAQLFAERRVPIKTSIQPGKNGELPVLVVEDCPYPVLAEQDRGICAVEKMLFSKLLHEDVALTQCRLDGAGCCEFAHA
jgi:DeoR family suf operon transcriptional repressor